MTARTAALAAAVLFAATAANAVPVTTDWSGLYIGASGGYDSRSAHFDGFTEQVSQATNFFVPSRGIVVVPGTSRAVAAGSGDASDGFGGALIGFNWQASNWVFGPEFEYTFGGGGSASSSSSFDLPVTALTPVTHVTTSRTARWNSSWALRARAGYAWDNLLAYVSVGVASAVVKVGASDTWFDPGGFAALNTTGPGAGTPACTPATADPANCPGTANIGVLGPVVTTAQSERSMTGYVLGVGGEWAFADNLSFGIDYRYTDFGRVAHNLGTTVVTDTGPAHPGGLAGQAVPGDTTVSLTDNRFSVRLIWRLNGLGG